MIGPLELLVLLVATLLIAALVALPLMWLMRGSRKRAELQRQVDDLRERLEHLDRP
ncbi:hypothetical protein [Deinococcus radiotolerans]|uniref:DUF4083 domain-containing protein n=1 Tax=Deinococcus radiotolerans TaxID=1309407 RepID=A0ABQ2FCU6_9DEIO|nr:hypothetical protein [Deinococcus radiotolerans]GGK85939.1 hypothetical protein GCM10010844_00550 [Deinococcus radiotolerans]